MGQRGWEGKCGLRGEQQRDRCSDTALVILNKRLKDAVASHPEYGPQCTYICFGIYTVNGNNETENDKN